MKPIVNQGILIIYCFSATLQAPADTAFVVAFLVAVIYVCLGNMEMPGRIKGIMPFVFLGAGCLFPKLLMFTPAVLYSMMERKKYMAASLLTLLCVLFYMKSEPEILALMAFGCIFAGASLYQVKQYERLEGDFHRTRDDSTELNLALKEKNQNLLKNQDYEVYTATLKERNRIAREIHDNVGHMLSRAILMVGAMKAVNGQESMKEPLEQLDDTLNTAMTNIRESVHDLHDDSVNLGEALSGLVEAYTFCPVKLTYDMGYFVQREVKYSFIAIVKEALNNISRHSTATEVKIVAREHPGIYQLIIEDNGKDGETHNIQEGNGLGIRNMKDRAASLGGIIQITEEDGFHIYITVPKKEE